MENKITIPAQRFVQHLSALQRDEQRFVDCPAGVCRQGENIEIIAATAPLLSGTRLRLSTDEGPPGSSFLRALPGNCIAFLETITSGSMRGCARGWVRGHDDVWQPVTKLCLPGPGMREVILQGGQHVSKSDGPGEMLGQGESRHSRSIGALGLESYRRVAGLKIGVVGLGRLGSQLASALVRFGIRQIVVVDLDQVERHNTAESEFEPCQVGKPKVQAWAEKMRAVNPEVSIVGIQESITTLKAVEALKSCALIFSAPDHAGARLAAAAVASAYCRPLMDVGTRVRGHGEPPTMVADVRLVLPERCLLCLGGVANEEHGLAVIESPDVEEWFGAFRQWQEERPGSLASLNTVAAGVALRLYEDFVLGRIQESLWTHIEFQENGKVRVSYPTPPAARSACACSISGWADDALGHFTGILRRRQNKSGTTRETE